MASRGRPRLLLVVHSARLGGAQSVALTQARALERDHDLTIAIGRGPLRDGFSRLGDLVRGPTRLPIWGASTTRWCLELGRVLPDALRLAWIARQRGIDVIIANSTVLVAPVIAARIARLPVVVQAQEAPKSRAVRRLFRFHGAFADTVIAISPWIAGAFEGARARVLHSPVGIPLPEWSPRGSRRSEQLRLVVVGSIDRHKRQDLAISALAALRRAGVEARLDLVGAESDPAYVEELRALIRRLGVESGVRFAGPSSEVPGWLASADALLLPAGEVTPLVLMESMALGTPVVAARMGSIEDVVGDGGLLVDPEDADAIARAVLRLQSEPDLPSSLSAAGRRRAETRFDAAHSQERLDAELRRLVSAHHRPAVGLSRMRRPFPRST
jgi:glycosyltransferase involved in cell wall biosynthesis